MITRPIYIETNEDCIIIRMPGYATEDLIFDEHIIGSERKVHLHHMCDVDEGLISVWIYRLVKYSGCMNKELAGRLIDVIKSVAPHIEFDWEATWRFIDNNLSE